MVVALLFELAGGGLPGGRRGEADRGIYSGGEEPTAGAHYYAGRGGEFSTEGCWDDAAAGDGAAFCVSGGAIGVVRDVSGEQERDCVLGAAWISYGSGGEEILFGED